MDKKITDGMVSLNEFSKIKKIEPEKIIEMVRDGFYEGQKIGSEWFIKEHEKQQNINKNEEAKNILFRIPAALVLAPGIGLFFSYIFTLGVSEFEGARGYAFLHYSVMLAIFAFFIILATKNTRIYGIYALLSFFGFVIINFA